MRLAEQVVIVDGAKRSALYDLVTNRIRRIPKTLANQLREGVIEKVVATKWLEHLVESRFLVNDEPDGVLDVYLPAFSRPRMPMIHTVTLDFEVSVLEKLGEWLVSARPYLELAHLVVIADVDDEINAMRFLRQCRNDTHATSCELIVKNGGRRCLGKIFDSDMQVRIWRRFVTGAPTMVDFIRADAETFSLLSEHSELSGHIHVDARGVVRPHWDEATVVLGTIEEPLDVIVRSRTFLDVRNNKKDGREKCRDCEIRYACVNPFCYRVAAELSSGPSNCPYDPLSDEPQNAAFGLAT